MLEETIRKDVGDNETNKGWEMMCSDERMRVNGIRSIQNQ